MSKFNDLLDEKIVGGQVTRVQEVKPVVKTCLLYTSDAADE